MQDRLAEIIGESDPDDIAVDIADEVDDKVARPKFMEAFFTEVENAQDEISRLRIATEEISELNRKALKAATTEDEEKNSESLQLVIENANKNAANAKKIIEKIKKDNGEIKKDKSTLDSELRIRSNMYTTLTRKFMDSMKDYQKAQERYKTDIKSKVKRQVQIVKPDASEEEIDMIMRSSDPGSIYKSAILQGTDDVIKSAYVNCHDKYQDVLRLEQSVAELHQMFLDLALLVDQQGEMLDQVEFQVNSASNYIESGNDQLAKAIIHQSCARKKQCCLLFFGLTVVLVIVLGTGVL